MVKFGIKAFQACGRHSFFGRIAVEEGISVWTPNLCETMARGSGKTERDPRDFT